MSGLKRRVDVVFSLVKLECCDPLSNGWCEHVVREETGMVRLKAKLELVSRTEVLEDDTRAGGQDHTGTVFRRKWDHKASERTVLLSK